MTVQLPHMPPTVSDWRRGSANLAAFEHFINDPTPGSVPLPGGGTIPNLIQLISLVGSGSIVSQPTLAGMTALPVPAEGQVCVVDGFWSANDGGGGAFVWSTSNDAAVVPGLIVRADALPSGAGRWLRLMADNRVVHALQMGVKINDNTAAATNAVALQAAFVYLYSYPDSAYPVTDPDADNYGYGGRIILPVGKIYCGRVFMRSRCTLQGQGIQSTLLIPTGLANADQYVLDSTGLADTQIDWMFWVEIRDLMIATAFSNPIGSPATGGGINFRMAAECKLERVRVQNVSGDCINMAGAQDCYVEDVYCGRAGDDVTDDKCGLRLDRVLLTGQPDDNNPAHYSSPSNSNHFHSMRFQESLVQMKIKHEFDNVFENCKWEAKFSDPATPAKGYIQIDNPDVTINHLRFVGCNFTPHSQNQPMFYIKQGFVHIENSSFQAAVGASYGYAIEIDNSVPVATFGNQVYISGCYFSGCRMPWNYVGDAFYGFDFQITDTQILYAESGILKLPKFARMYDCLVVVGFENISGNKDVIEIQGQCDVANCDFRAVAPMADDDHGRVNITGDFNIVQNIRYQLPEGIELAGAANFLVNAMPIGDPSGPINNSGDHNMIHKPFYHPDGADSHAFFQGALGPGAAVVNLDLQENAYIVILNGDVDITLSSTPQAPDVNSPDWPRMYGLEFFVFSDGSSHTLTWPPEFKSAGVVAPLEGANKMTAYRWLYMPTSGPVGNYWVLQSREENDVS